jgi:hypothetical protein
MAVTRRGTSPHRIQQALERIRDQRSFLQELLIDALNWEVPEKAEAVEEISFGWSQAELRAADLTKHLIDGSVWQLQSLDKSQPWGIFILEFINPDAFTTGRGMAGPLRKVLRGLVPSRRKDSAAKSWLREHLLFICTHRFEHFRVAYFKSPPDKKTAAPLAAFGWGPGVPNRTACEINLPELVWPHDPQDGEAWIKQWSAAFDVEKVTRKFYEEYKAVFTEVEGRIKTASGIKSDEELRLFTQTLFNRLMFLRFMERKGWLDFGGDHDYLAALMRAGGIGGKTVYQSRLRPLFFQGLAVEGKQESKAIGKVPFLNGGLFEETELDKKAQDVPDTALSPILGQSGALGLFYRYNFTVQESTPLDIEVAVDPEMLGKVFEELVTGRHESGSYYTPRPVVSFMCREALKGYLAEVTQIDAEKIADFVDKHDVARISIDGAKKIAQGLDEVRAVDPACGSGAYLLGLLHEIVDLYRLLYSDKLKTSSRELHKIKLDIIEKSLYGADIDPFATNIAMLRLWLSLTVDSDEPQALPNLDFKIETGDSVTGPDPQEMPDLLRANLVARARDLAAVKGKYLRAHGDDKQSLRKLIHKEQSEIADELHSLSPGAIDWRVQFCEIFFSKRAGFDIVLANPPYIRQELIKALKPALKSVYQALYSGTADLYVFFYLRGLQLLAPGGMLVYISSNKWFRAGYGEKLRAHVARTTTVQTILDFHDLPVFEAIAYPMIFVAKKQPPSDEHTATLAEPPDLEPPYPDVKEVVAKYGHQMPTTALGRDGTWHLQVASVNTQSSRFRGSPLRELLGSDFFRGLSTGLNDAFIISDETRQSIIKADPASKKLIKPYLAGKDVKRWRVEDRGLWVIYSPWELDITKYPGVATHLRQFEAELKARPECRAKRYNWWCMARYGAEYAAYFDLPKIVSTKVSIRPTFTLDTEGHYLGNTSYFATVTDKEVGHFLLGLLNSSTFYKYAVETFVGKQSGWYEVQPDGLEKFPVPDASAADRSAIAALAQKCLDARGVGCEAWEKEIDERVAALYGLDAADLGDKSSRPAPIYDTKGHLVHRVIPKLAKATPGFPYFSLDAIKAELEKHRGEAKPESLNHYMHELTSEGVVYDAGRGWYSTLSEPLALDREPVRELVETVEKRFPFLEFSCWSTKQVAAYGHHLLARFTSFVYTQREAMESVADALRESGKTVFVDPGKALIGKSVKLSDGAIVVRPLVTRAPEDGHYALAEKVLVDLFKESDDLKLMDPAECEKILGNAISAYRVSISAILAYAERRNATRLALVESINAK